MSGRKPKRRPGNSEETHYSADPDEVTVATPPVPPTDVLAGPTPRMRMIGERLRASREMAGLAQAEVCAALGYSKSTQLSLAEAGQRMLPFERVIELAGLYAVSTDYLAGITDAPECDPVAALHRSVASRMSTDLNNLIRAMTVQTTVRLRQALPCLSDAERLALRVQELADAMGNISAKHPEWGDLPVTRVLSLMDRLNAAATDYLEQVRHSRATAALSAPGAAANVEGARDHLQMSLDLLGFLDK